MLISFFKVHCENYTHLSIIIVVHSIHLFQINHYIKTFKSQIIT